MTMTSKQDLIQLAVTRLRAPDGGKAASKYDYVKVKVWLGDDMAHYYVLSRFLISRMLTVTKVPQQKAVKIALDVKKYLVDNDRLDIPQAELETIMFSVMRSKGFGDEYINRYKMVNQFFQQKRPLIILICGSACTGKSTFAQQLASRLNLPNVLQTDILYELLRTSELGALSSTPLWSREGLADEQLVSEFQKECRIIRRGLEGDLIKCIKDGKPIIVEGLHLDPGLYLDEFGRHGMIGMGGISLFPEQQQATEGQGPSAVQQQASGPGSVSESMDASPPSPLAQLTSSEGTPSPLLGSPGTVPTSPAAPTSDIAEDVDSPALRPEPSVSFSDASSSGQHRPPSFSRASPWNRLQPGGFLHRLLRRSGSGGVLQPQDTAAAVAHEAEPQSQSQLLSPTHSDPQQQQQQQELQPQHSQQPWTSPRRTSPVARPVLRSLSAGRVTFMLQQQPDDDGSPFSPTPIMPGTEVMLPSSSLPMGEELLPPVPEQEVACAPSEEPPAEQQQQQQSSGAAEQRQAPGAASSPKASGALQAVQRYDACSSSSGSSSAEAWPNSREQFASGWPDGPSTSGTSTAAAPSAADEQATAVHSTQQAEQQQQERHQQPGAGPMHEPACPPTASSRVDPEADAALPPLRVEPSQQQQQQQHPSPPPQQAQHAAGGAAGPVFVPIVLSMESHDYELVVQEWQAVQGSGPPVGEDDGLGQQQQQLGEQQQGEVQQQQGQPHDEEAAASVLRRLCVLQDYLCAYRAVGVPVVQVNVGSFHDTLNKLHDYLLQCIEMSL